MDASPSPGTTPRFDSQLQARIYERLGLVGPAPQALFADAITLVANKLDYESSSHMLGHVLRELDGVLVHMMLPDNFQASAEGAIDDATRREKVSAILGHLGAPADEYPFESWCGLRGLHKQAHRIGAITLRRLSDADLARWNEYQSILDSVLERFTRRFTSYFPRIDAMAKRSRPSAADVRRLRASIPHNRVTQKRLLSQIDGQWLDGLREAGFFARPTEPAHVLERAHTRIPGRHPSFSLNRRNSFRRPRCDA